MAAVIFVSHYLYEPLGSHFNFPVTVKTVKISNLEFSKLFRKNPICTGNGPVEYAVSLKPTFRRIGWRWGLHDLLQSAGDPEADP